MDKLGYSSRAQRPARTRSLIIIGDLVEKAGLVSTFDITLSADLQRDISMKHPIAALFKALLMLNELVQSGQLHPYTFCTPRT